MGYAEILPIGTWDYCDKCEKPKLLATGYHVMVNGQSVTWLCEDCK